MKLTARIPVTAGSMAILLLSATGCARLRANDQINKGVADFKNAKLESAENHFQNAINIDPDNPNPRIYLATTYSSQIVPNLDTAANKKLAQEALDNFQVVLQKDPNNVIALKQIAVIDRDLGKQDEAKSFEKKVIALSPNDYEAYESIGATDFYQSYKNAVAVLAGEHLTDGGDGNLKLSKPGCAKLTAENQPLVTEGLDSLKKAVDINPTDESAMTFLSLTSRRKADLECGNIPAVKADLSDADMWAQKSMGARKANEAAKEAKEHGVTQ